MSSNYWSKRRVHKKGFRAILVLDIKHSSKHFHPIFTKTKTIFKTVHTTIQRHDVIRNSFPLTLHVHMDSFYVHHQYATNKQLYQMMQRVIYAKNSLTILPIQTFQYSNVYGNVHLLMEKQMYLEQKYFQSHPSKARQLAMSYLQQGVLKTILQEFLHSKEVYSSYSKQQVSKTTLLQHYLNIQQMANIYKPVFVQSDGEVYNPLLAKQKEIKEDSIVLDSEKKPKEDQAANESVDMTAIIRYVYEEVMRRFRQEGMRKGRRL